MQHMLEMFHSIGYSNSYVWATKTSPATYFIQGT